MQARVEMLKDLDNADQAVAYKTYQMLEMTALAYTARDKAAPREEMAAFLAAELNATDPGGKDNNGNDKPPVPRYSMRVRRQIARLLGYVAGAAEVPALAAAMKDLELREEARCALDRNQSEAATEALVAALDEVGPTFRVGVAGSLAGRSGSSVTKALQALIDDEDGAVRVAAADTLATIPNADSHDVLVTLSKRECRPTRQAAHKARIRLAETLARAGDKAAARKIYQAVRHSEAGEPQKKAAGIGLDSLK
jgi:HEAT repeat protein